MLPSRTCFLCKHCLFLCRFWIDPRIFIVSLKNAYPEFNLGLISYSRQSFFFFFSVFVQKLIALDKPWVESKRLKHLKFKHSDISQNKTKPTPNFGKKDMRKCHSSESQQLWCNPSVSVGNSWSNHTWLIYFIIFRFFFVHLFFYLFICSVN